MQEETIQEQELLTESVQKDLTKIMGNLGVFAGLLKAQFSGIISTFIPKGQKGSADTQIEKIYVTGSVKIQVVNTATKQKTRYVIPAEKMNEIIGSISEKFSK